MSSKSLGASSPLRDEHAGTLMQTGPKILLTGSNTLISRTDGGEMNSHLKANGM